MKQLFMLLFFVGVTGMAQLKGNGEIVEQSFPIEKIHTLEINLTADFILDAENENGIAIKTDSNLMSYISRDFKNGHLNISQVKWIQPTKRPQIRVGISSLKKLINDAHSTTQLVHINRDTLEVVANVGKLSLSGKVKHLDLIVGTALVEGEALKAQKANIRITSFGSVRLSVVEEAITCVSANGKLSFVKEPIEIIGNYSKSEQTIADMKARFIHIKLKNNSLNLNKYVVVGPKADGSTFSYGFELWPLQGKKERWTIGSELFEVSKSGKRVSVLKLSAKDEDNLIKLY